MTSEESIKEIDLENVFTEQFKERINEERITLLPGNIRQINGHIIFRGIQRYEESIDLDQSGYYDTTWSLYRMIDVDTTFWENSSNFSNYISIRRVNRFNTQEREQVEELLNAKDNRDSKVIWHDELRFFIVKNMYYVGD